MANESRMRKSMYLKVLTYVGCGIAIPLFMLIMGFLVIMLGCKRTDTPTRNMTTNTNVSQPNIEKKINPIDGSEMVLIPAGEFEMGIDKSEIPWSNQWEKKWHPNTKWWYEDEIPRHTVYIDAFYMDTHEVTNKQYKKFVQATGHKEPEGYGFYKVEGNRATYKRGFKPWADLNYNRNDQPVVCVTWEDAKAYAEWAGKRLPTEAEWEKAARGGLIGKKFPWGDADPDGTKCNFADKNTNFPWSDKNVNDKYQYAAPVGKYPPNGYGLYDMEGNVTEWCMDWYNEVYYTISPKQNPTGPSSGKDRVLRGGSWYCNAPYGFRVSYRTFYSDPTRTIFDVGFRCVGLSVTP